MLKFFYAVFVLVLAAIGTVVCGVVYAQSPANAAPLESAPLAISDIALSGLAQPRVIVAPEYPSTEVATKSKGHVDLEIVIAEGGNLGGIRSLTSTPKNEEFENAVRSVIQLWLFYPAWSKCRPIESVGNVRVWFDIKDGVGAVSVSRRKSPPPALESGMRKRIVSADKVAEITSAVSYPRRAREAGAQGETYIKITVDPVTGKITGIDEYSRSVPAGYERHFGNASRTAIERLKLEPNPDYDRPVEVCFPFKFRLTN